MPPTLAEEKYPGKWATSSAGQTRHHNDEVGGSSPCVAHQLQDIFYKKITKNVHFMCCKSGDERV